MRVSHVYLHNQHHVPMSQRHTRNIERRNALTSAVSRFIGKLAAVALLAVTASSSPAQTARRVLSIDAHQQTTLTGSRHPLTVGAAATGRLDAATRLSGVTLHFKMTAAQQADLQALLAAQQNPSSGQYHQWLTPTQFAARFGVSDADISTISAWLEQQGFVVQGTNISHTQLSFSGTAAQLEQAFSTQLQTYNVAGQSVYAPSQDLSLPTAVASVVHGVGNLSSFRPRAHHHPVPRFTSSTSGNHYVAPDDFATIYDVKPVYNAGSTGSGITIAVVGQTAIATTDVSAFRSASGLPAATPTLTLVPNSGVSTEAGGADEEESDLDVEWSGAVAKNATINFVYVGNSTNFSVFDSLLYAIDNKVAPIISISYGGCELQYTSADVSTIQSWLTQANAQGQTVVAASGDSAAADCDFTSNPSQPVTSATHGLAVDLPSSFPYVTGIGGTTFSGDTSSPSTYWSSSNNASNGSALLYIPEQAWNDTSTTNGLEGGGGGVSILFGEPSWQTGTGVPSDAGRNVPDISLAGSPNHDGYLYCSVGSCTSGFRDATGNLTVAGGTSFGAPTFSGILALIEQQLGSKGLGNINPTLYSIASASPTAFHDITSGNNIVPCTAGSAGCGSSGTIGYSAGPGYDQVTGLGTPDVNVLAAAFTTANSGGGSALIATNTVLTASTSTPAPSANLTYTATVTPNNGSGTPDGTVQFAVDGTASGAPVTLASGAATFTTSFAAVGSHAITATYSGSGTYAASSGTLSSNVAIIGGFTLGATDLTVKQGGSGTSTITVTPTGGFTGAVNFTASAPATLTNACYTITTATVTGTTAATATMTLYTTQSACTTAGSRKLLVPAKTSGGGRPPFTFLYAGLLPLLCLTGIRRRRNGWNSIALVVCAGGTLLWLSGCGGGGSSSSTTTPKGTYAITVTGTNSTGNLSNNTTLNLTVN
jgi:subtilase family serine protease